MSYKKVAIVTGSNKGIGFAIVRALCKEYDGVVYLTSRTVELGKEAVKQLKSENLDANYHQLDICDDKSVNRLKDYMVAKYGGIDVLINNAGIAYKVASTVPFSEQAKVTMKTNFTATLNICNTLLPVIKENGRVVNVSGFLSKMGLNRCSKELQAVFRSNEITEQDLVEKMEEFVKDAAEDKHKERGWPESGYAVSKLGVTVMTRILARNLKEQGKRGILLNCCCPGWVKTDMAGPKATKTPDQGAETPVFLALLPTGATEPYGEFLSDKTVQEW